MANLEDDAFFSDRVVAAVKKCLDRDERLNIISPQELKILNHGPLVRKLNRELDGKLIERLRQWQKAMPLYAAMEILIDAVREGALEMVVDLLDTALSLEMKLDLEGAYTVLEKSFEEGLAASWVLQIYGSELDAEPDEDTKPFSIGSL